MIRDLRLFALAALIACLGPLGFPSSAQAQQSESPRRIGVLLVTFSPESKEAEAFRQGLRDLGSIEGRDLVIEWRFANGDYDRVPELVSALLQRKVDLIVVDSTVATRAARRATSTVPIVMASVADPVGSGLVANLAHPAGNVTGFSMMTAELSAKRLELLKETIPRLSRVAVLWNPATPYHPKMIDELKAAAPSMSIQLKFVGVRAAEEFGTALSAARRETHAQALYVIDDPLFLTHRSTILKLVQKNQLPAIFGEREYVEEGGLMSYGRNAGDLFRRSAGYVHKILKGANPGDLPIEQPTKFEFAINLKTAKALGITVPESVVFRADEVIR